MKGENLDSFIYLITVKLPPFFPRSLSNLLRTTIFVSADFSFYTLPTDKSSPLWSTVDLLDELVVFLH